MKSYFLRLLCCSIVATGAASAAEITVNSTSAMADAWNQAADGDTLILASTIDLSAIDALQARDISLNITGTENASLVWTGSSLNCPLPASVVYSNLEIIGAPSKLLSGQDLVVGEGNTFEGHSQGVISAAGNSVIGKNNTFRSNVNQGDGGVLLVEDGSEVCIGAGNVFHGNMSAGRGGAIAIENQGAALEEGQYHLVLDASAASSSIIFTGNTEEALLDDKGAVTDPGFSNDLYLGSQAQVLLQTGEESVIVLGSGLASEDDSALMVKTGNGTAVVADAAFYGGSLEVQEGTVVLDSKQVWGDGTGNAAITVQRPGAFVLETGATLNRNLNLQGGALVLAGPATVQSALTATSGSTLVFTLSSDALQQETLATTPWLTLAPGATLDQTSAQSLTLNLDMTSIRGKVDTDKSLFAIDASGDAETQQAIQSLKVTYTDRQGAHTTNLSLDESGMLDLSSILETIMKTLDPEHLGASQANPLWSSMQSLSWLRGAASSHNSSQTQAPSQGTRVWGAGMGGSVEMSSTAHTAGYRYNGGGYAVGAEAILGRNSYAGLTLGQTFGSGKSKGGAVYDQGAKVDQAAIMFGLYGQYALTLQKADELILSLFAGYARVDNDFKQQGASTSWDDDAFHVAGRLSWEHRAGQNLFWAPFIGLEYHTASQESYALGGYHFRDGEASTLTLPIGVTLSLRMEECEQKAITPYLSVAYVPYLVQDAPEVTVTQGGDSWIARGARPGRHAVRAEAGITVEWDDNWTTNIHASLQSREHSNSFHIGASVGYGF